MTAIWPDIPFAAWKDSGAALHMWLQVVGKYRLARTPWVNHSWHAVFHLTGRGLTSSLVHDKALAIEILFDFIDHDLVLQSSEGEEERLPLEAMSVAEFDRRFKAALGAIGATASYDGSPNEVPNPVPFAAQEEPGVYDAAAITRFWRALLAIDRVFKHFRTGFLGKVSPVHLFWGSLDLAVTRFSGRTAPPHPGGFPALPDTVTREAYSHEVSSAGFWPGGGTIKEPAFYAYAYPSPNGFGNAKVEPQGAYFDPVLGEFILPYDVVRTADDPDAALLAFLQTTYLAAADLGGWARSDLEAPLGKPGKPRPITA